MSVTNHQYLSFRALQIAFIPIALHLRVALKSQYVFVVVDANPPSPHTHHPPPPHTHTPTHPHPHIHTPTPTHTHNINNLTVIEVDNVFVIIYSSDNRNSQSWQRVNCAYTITITSIVCIDFHQNENRLTDRAISVQNQSNKNIIYSCQTV